MTDETNPTPVPGRPGAGPSPGAGPGASPGTGPGEPVTAGIPAERARIETAPAKRLDTLPVLYLVGFVILAASLIYLWKHPALPRNAALEVARMDTLRQQTNAIQARVDALEARPAPVIPAAPDLGPLAARLAELEKRPVPSASDLATLGTRLGAVEARPVPTVDMGPIERRLGALETKPAVDLGPLEGRIAALEGKPAVDLTPLDGRIATLEKKPPVDLRPVEGRIATLEAKPPVDLGPLQGRVDAVARTAGDEVAALAKRLDALEAQGKLTAANLSAVADKAARAGRLQAASAALEAGQRLGEIPGAPAALARFAHDAPPTEAGLRLSFDKAADAAQKVSLPATTADQPLLSRMWTKAQQSVTVRQGDRVLVGDPIAGVLASARQSLDAGDLAGAVKALEGLTPGPKAAMADWVAQAQALLEARAAIGEMAARS